MEKKMKKSPDKSKQIGLIFRLFEFARPYRGRLIIVFVLVILQTVLGLVPAYMMKPLTDRVFAPITPIPSAERIRVLNALKILNNEKNLYSFKLRIF